MLFTQILELNFTFISNVSNGHFITPPNILYLLYCYIFHNGSRFLLALQTYFEVNNRVLLVLFITKNNTGNLTMIKTTIYLMTLIVSIPTVKVS